MLPCSCLNLAPLQFNSHHFACFAGLAYVAKKRDQLLHALLDVVVMNSNAKQFGRTVDYFLWHIAIVPIFVKQALKTGDVMMSHCC
jgi:hypothetical protein